MQRVLESVEKLSPQKLAQVRDLVDVESHGIGFLTLVMRHSEKHYEALAKVRLPCIRLAIGQGITRERQVLAEEPKPEGHGPLKGGSDIDDTFMSSWIDVFGSDRGSFPRGTVYPGMRDRPPSLACTELRR